MHVRLADHAICIGPPPATDSYLNTAAIISAATRQVQATPMPTRMPVPFGAAIGMGAGGLTHGLRNVYALQLEQQQAKGAQIANERAHVAISRVHVPAHERHLVDVYGVPRGDGRRSDLRPF